MRSIYDYMDYRKFIQDGFAALKEKNPLFSFRSFNRLAGIQSSGFLKMVMDGKRNLSDDGIQMIAKGFKLSDTERRYFKSLVKFNQSDTAEDKDHFFKELTENKGFVAAKPITAAQFHLFTHWYYVAILELVRLDTKKPKTIAWLQDHIDPIVDLLELKRAVKDLIRLNLLTEEPSNGLKAKETVLTTDDEVQSIAVTQFHVAMSGLAARRVNSEDHENREFSTITVATSERGFHLAKQELIKFKKRLFSLMEQEAEQPKTVVGHVNLQLFRLNKGGRE